MKKFWKSFKLKAQLFRIWFFKNILMFLQIIAIVCVICILTGSITESTPILGKIIYPIFQPLIDEIVSLINEKDISGLMDFFTLAISILTSVGVFCMKCKSITQADIKSDKLKIALLNANLYFNSDGRLVKKVETITQTDIDGDGKVDESNDTSKGNRLLHGGLINAVKEFILISKADFTEKDDENDNKYKEILEEANMTESAEGIKELDNTISEGVGNAIADKADIILDEKIEDASEDDEITDSEKEAKINLFQKTKTWISATFRKTKKEIDEPTAHEDVETIVNNIEEDNKKKDEKSVVVKEETRSVESIIKTNTTTSASKNNIDDFLNSLRNK